ncbi:MAG: acyltransferase [Pseudomonadota bacterium]
MNALRLALFMMAELVLRICVVPQLRASLVRLLGAQVGRNARIYECQFINLRAGFRNLTVGDDVHIGPGCLIDLQGPVAIGNGTSISPRVCVISHADPGSAHDSWLCQHFPPRAEGVRIGAECWIGTGSILLSGASVADRAVIGAGSVVRGACEGSAVHAGAPARLVRRLSGELDGGRRQGP